MSGIAENHYGNFIGQVIVKIEKSDEEIVFHLENGKIWRMLHYQDCCESVTIDDICGDLDDLINTPIIQAFEKTSDKNPVGITVPEYQDCFTWTFYTFSTIKGTVTIRWYGESNGYYSESVDFREDQSV